MVKYVLTLEYERERQEIKRMFNLKERRCIVEKTCNFPLGRDDLVEKKKFQI